jgi:phosphoglycolate phosphatase-like HAD superfamily hydrolase
MIVFDVDGTLIGGELTDWASFGAAFEDAAGFRLSAQFFADLEEVTAQAIVHQALPEHLPEEKKRIEQAVRTRYLNYLREAHERDHDCFPALGEGPALLNELRERGIPVAIATGDWRETISFKLQAAGFSIQSVPLVTSSEYYSRAEIIAQAVALAGGSLSEAIYVGDGLWDLRACRKLGIRFIGVGNKREKLLEAAAPHVLDDLTANEFWRAHAAIGMSQLG